MPGLSLSRSSLRRCRLGAVAASFVLAGCVPAPLGTYYKPLTAGAGATYSGELCQGAAGAPAVMQIELASGVTLVVRAGMPPAASAAAPARGGVALAMTLRVPEGVTTQFADAQIAISADGQERRVTAPALQVLAWRQIDGAAMFDLTRDSPTPSLFAAGAAPVAGFRSVASINYAVPGFAPSRLEAQLPGLRIVDASGSRLLPPLTVQAGADDTQGSAARDPGRQMIVYRTQDRVAAVHERHAQCLREPSRTAQQCARIPQYDERSLDALHGGVRYAGRWYVFDPRASSPFMGELTIEQNAPARWQLAPPAITLRDLSAASGTPARTHAIGRVSVSLSYAAPFTSAFVGVDNTRKDSTTRVTMQLPLDPGDARSPGPARRYVVRLPAISINGTVVPIQPIEFEQRRLDVGLLPFNC